VSDAEQERAEVVAWLRDQAARLKDDIASDFWSGCERWGEMIVECYEDSANVIESGDHLRDKAG
jgi:hypothetical protein